jgi:hypothetical protein
MIIGNAHEASVAESGSCSRLASERAMNRLTPRHGEVSCQACGAEAFLSVEMPSMGTTPGARVYQCPACDHHTWIDWRRRPDPIR